MTFNPRDSVLWFFCWASTKQEPRRDYPTSICSFTRRDLIAEVEKAHGCKWRKLYREGARAIKCRVKPLHEKRAEP